MLKDTHQLLKGSGKLIRHIPIDTPPDYRNKKVKDLLKEAVAFVFQEMGKSTKS